MCFLLDFLLKRVATLAKLLIFLRPLALKVLNQAPLKGIMRSASFEPETAPSLRFNLCQQLLESLLMLRSMREHPCPGLQVDRASLLKTPPAQHAQTRWRGWRLGKENKPLVCHTG